MNVISIPFIVDKTTYVLEFNIKLEGKCESLRHMFSDVQDWAANLSLLHKQ
jgi:hypothetical protein